MTGLRLFLASRRSGALFIGLLAVVVACVLLGPRSFLVGSVTPVPIPWIVLLPVVAAYLVAGATVPPTPFQELLASVPVAALSRMFMLVAGALTAAGLWWATSPTPPPVGGPAAVRVFLGFLGLSVISIWAVGVTLGWVPPLLLILGAVFMRPSGYSFLVVDWPVRDDWDPAAWVTALVWLACGVGATWTRRFWTRSAAD